MSGGSLDYVYNRVQEHVGCFDDKQLDNLLRDMAKLLHDREWYLSGDYCEGEWNLSKVLFKGKWLGAKDDGVYCYHCAHFYGQGQEYGKCKHKENCLIHRYITPCEMFEPFPEP